MNPQEYSCQHKDCAMYGKLGEKNLVIHSQKQKRLKCKVCGKTFTISKGTGFYRLRTSQEIIQIVMILRMFGCPPMAIHRAFGFDLRTIDNWINRFGKSCKSLHQSWASAIFKYARVQADELWLKLKKGKAWIGTALEVNSRLWLGLEVGKRRTNLMIKCLYEQVKYILVSGCKLLIETDGFGSYGSQAKKVFRTKVVKNKRYRYQLWEDLVVIQVIKSYTKKGKAYLFSGLNKIKLACGEWKQYAQYVKKYKINWANTAYIERHNATLRGQLYCLVRKGRAIKKNLKTVENLLWMKLAVYNYATYHRSLTCKETKKKNTPAMKAGITNTKINVRDVLYFNTVSKKINNFSVHT